MLIKQGTYNSYAVNKNCNIGGLSLLQYRVILCQNCFHLNKPKDWQNQKNKYKMLVVEENWKLKRSAGSHNSFIWTLVEGTGLVHVLVCPHATECCVGLKVVCNNVMFMERRTSEIHRDHTYILSFCIGTVENVNLI